MPRAQPVAQPSTERRYQILLRLGQGAFGRVYKARYMQGPVEMDVALKVINRSSGEHDELLRRLLDEARYLGLLNHDVIVRVLGVVQLGGEWAVVMELAEGADLRAFVRAGPVPPRVALEITADLAGALHYAWHRSGADGKPLHLIHRDIKPSNIQLTTAGKVKLLDFGIARGETARASETHSMQLLTPAYSSPERLRRWMEDEGASPGAQHGPAGDVFSLGMVLAEMVLGWRPTQAVLQESLYPTWLGEIIEAIEAIEGVHAELPRLVRSMLAMRGAERPTAAEVEARCHTLLEEQRGERLRSWVPRTLPSVTGGGTTHALDPWVGQTLTESDDDASVHTLEPRSAETQTPDRRRLAALLGAALALGGVAFGSILWVRNRSTEPEPVAPTTEAAPPTPAPAPPTLTEAAPPTPAPAPTAAVEPTPVTTATPSATPTTGPSSTPGSSGKAPRTTPSVSPRSRTTATTTTTSEPTPPMPPSAPVEVASAPPTFRVQNTGDGTVKLKGAGGTYTLPAEVPAGTYRIIVAFQRRPGEGAIGTIDITADTVLRCSDATATCPQVP